MNVTELARILRITPHELRTYLPKFGYDVGQKAIKINRNVANKIIKDWPRLRRRIQAEKDAELAKQEEETKEARKQLNKTVKIPNLITVKEFSQISDLPLNSVLAELMKNGVFASMNEKIDFDTAWLVGEELGVTVKRGDNTKDELPQEEKVKQILDNEEDKNLASRPPVIVVMGHVDHGKTKLLDAIRTTNVIKSEAGGITQHIGAYQVVKNNKPITFIDTPGHEAFTAMRSRGAKIADIAILVVAADDGVKPQTIEAFRIIEKAGVPLIVAINKIDKPDANLDKTKQELSNQLKLVPEDWGGKTICTPVSALKGEGIDNLLDMILLVADMESDKIKANPNADAIGTVIESHIDKGAGPIATILIQNGTLKVGNNLMLNDIDYGKVRALYNHKGEKIQEASLSTPAKIIGLKMSPKVGDILEVGIGKKLKTKKMKSIDKILPQSETEDKKTDKKSINLIIKSDVLGSAEAIEESLEKIQSAVIGVKILHKGLGNITEGDISRAESSNGLIVGFNIHLTPVIEELAREKKVTVKIYNVIYDLIDDVKKEMQNMVVAETKKELIGKMEVLAIFRTEQKRQVIGGKVTEGFIENKTIAEIFRKDELIAEGTIESLQAGKQNVTKVEIGEECGIDFSGKPAAMVGDVVNIYKVEEIIAKI